MKIQIVGPGCGRCQATEKIVHEVCAELNLEAIVDHVYDSPRVQQIRDNAGSSSAG